jgi:hypothetical protein
VDPNVAYGGLPRFYGQVNDPMVGRRVGGVNVFGGGLALYNAQGKVIGAIGVSGDTSCADHHIGWRARANLMLDYVPDGVSGDSTRPDNILFDDMNGDNNGITDGFEHPSCIATANPSVLPAVRVVVPPN